MRKTTTPKSVLLQTDRKRYRYKKHVYISFSLKTNYTLMYMERKNRLANMTSSVGLSLLVKLGFLLSSHFFLKR